MGEASEQTKRTNDMKRKFACGGRFVSHETSTVWARLARVTFPWIHFICSRFVIIVSDLKMSSSHPFYTRYKPTTNKLHFYRFFPSFFLSVSFSVTGSRRWYGGGDAIVIQINTRRRRQSISITVI